jgi:hypothetical protein
VPKAKWGAGDNALTMEDLNNAEVPEARTRYSGPVPPAGTYRFTLARIKKGVSQQGNDKLNIRFMLDGSWQPHHKQYDGAPVFNDLALTKGNAPQVAQFLGAIGATYADLLNGTIVDEDGYVTKLGRVGDPEGIMLYLNCERSKPTDKYPDPRLQVAYGGYIMADEDGDADSGDADSGGDEPPF